MPWRAHYGEVVHVLVLNERQVADLRYLGGNMWGFINQVGASDNISARGLEDAKQEVERRMARDLKLMLLDLGCP